MRGGISLDSVLGQGTTASFWIPFNKPQFVSTEKTPVADVRALSERLQSELSISGCDSDPDRIKSNPQSPMDTNTLGKAKRSTPRPRPSPVQKTDKENLDANERKNMHVLVVEDK